MADNGQRLSFTFVYHRPRLHDTYMSDVPKSTDFGHRLRGQRTSAANQSHFVASGRDLSNKSLLGVVPVALEERQWVGESVSNKIMAVQSLLSMHVINSGH